MIEIGQNNRVTDLFAKRLGKEIVIEVETKVTDDKDQRETFRRSASQVEGRTFQAYVVTSKDGEVRKFEEFKGENQGVINRLT